MIHSTLKITSLISGIALLIIVNTPLAAQDAIADFTAINKAYENHTKVSMLIDYSLYSKLSDKFPEKRMTGFYKRQEQWTHSKLLGVETIQNDNYLLMVDPAEKVIMISNPPTNAAATPISVSIEQALAICESVQFNPESADQASYTMTFNPESSEYHHIKIFFNKNNWFITAIELISNNLFGLTQEQQKEVIAQNKEKSKVVIAYRELNTTATFNASEFSEAAYIKRNQESWEATQQYANYRIINNYFK